jgi:hypothetical protein
VLPLLVLVVLPLLVLVEANGHRMALLVSEVRGK